jgi:alkylated DNA repair dioxygenase AlkB
MKHYQYHEQFLYKEEADVLENYLEENIPWKQVTYFKPERGYVITPRLTWVAGFHNKNVYEIDGLTLNEIPLFFLPLKDLVEDFLKTEFNFILFSKYRDENDSITYHSDDEKFLGRSPTIASLTLGATRPFVLKNKRTRESQSFDPKHGDLFVMQSNCQKDFFHALPKSKKAFNTRYSITFKKVLNEYGTKNYYKFNLGTKIQKIT